MSETTKIEWCDSTFNHIIGCRKVSAGCANCYAETLANRFGNFSVVRRTSAANWREPVKWNKKPWICDKCGNATDELPPKIGHGFCLKTGCLNLTFHLRTVFCASLSDWLIDADVVSPNGTLDKGGLRALADMLDLTADTLNLRWLLLSKRLATWRPRMQALNSHRVASYWLGGVPPKNIWPGTSIEDQESADRRIPELLCIPAAGRFLSVEPLLGPIKLDLTGIDWVIVGGESGPNARPCNIEWIRDIVRQCKAAKVPCFVKQLGSYATETGMAHAPDCIDESCCMAGGPDDCYGPIPTEYAVKTRHPKGGDPSEWCEDLRVRERTAI